MSENLAPSKSRISTAQTTISRCSLCNSSDTTFAFSQCDLTGSVNPSVTFNVWICRHCSSSFLNPIPTESELLEAYSNNYYSFESSHSKNETRIKAFTNENIGFWSAWIKPIFYRNHAELMRSELAWAIRRRSTLSINTVLEMGCGDGTYTRILSSLFPNARIIAQDKYLQLGSQPKLDNVTWISNLSELQSETIDLIVARNVIEHFIDAQLELQTASKLLKSNGIIVGELPNRNSLDRWVFSKFWFGYEIPRHIIAATRKGLTDLCARSGLEVVQYRTHPVHGSWIFYLSVENLIRSTFGFKPKSYLWKILLIPLTFVYIIASLFQLGGTSESVIVKKTF